MDAYKKIVKVCLRNKMALIWMFIFPIVLSTLFYFAFGSLDESEKLEQIPVALVSTALEQQEPALLELLRGLSNTKEGLLDLRETSGIEEAEELLKAGTVAGIITVPDGAPLLTVRQNGMEQSILHSILSRYLQMKEAAAQAMEIGGPASGKQAAKKLAQESTLTAQQVSLSENPPSLTLGYFYSLLAMVCLYASFLGNVAVEMRQANLSAVGARQCVAPQRPVRALLRDLAAYYTVGCLSVALAVLYMNSVLGVSFGRRWGLVLLTCMAGTAVGLLFGAAVSVSNRLRDTTKTGVIVTVTMVCCFLAGMMIGGINYQIAQKVPLLDRLNPAARISDAFYSLYYYDGYGRYLESMGMLAGMAALLFLVVLAFERRQRYESI